MDVTLSQYRVYYKSLGLKMACAIVIVAVVPLLIMAAFSRHFFVGSYKQKVLDHLIALVRIQQQKVGEFVTERLDALRLIGLTTSFEQLSDETILEERWAALKQMYGKSLLGLAFLRPPGCANFARRVRWVENGRSVWVGHAGEGAGIGIVCWGDAPQLHRLAVFHLGSKGGAISGEKDPARYGGR